MAIFSLSLRAIFICFQRISERFEKCEEFSRTFFWEFCNFSIFFPFSPYISYMSALSEAQTKCNFRSRRLKCSVVQNKNSLWTWVKHSTYCLWQCFHRRFELNFCSFPLKFLFKTYKQFDSTVLIICSFSLFFQLSSNMKHTLDLLEVQCNFVEKKKADPSSPLETIAGNLTDTLYITHPNTRNSHLARQFARVSKQILSGIVTIEGKS